MSEASATPLSDAPLPGGRVRDPRGAQATVIAESGAPPGSVLLELDGGGVARLPADLLVRSADGQYWCMVAFDALGGSASQEPAAARLVIPVIEESLEVRKHVVTRGGWRITKTIESREQLVDEPLARDELSVERVPMNQVVPPDALPGVRHEGDTMVVPVFEEVLVVEKRMLLKEELRIRRTRKEFRAPQAVELRREHVSVQRIGDDGEPAAPMDDRAAGP